VEELVEEEIIINNIDAMKVIEQEAAEDIAVVDVEVADYNDDDDDVHFDDDLIEHKNEQQQIQVPLVVFMEQQQ
jgi:hypothetical protein